MLSAARYLWYVWILCGCSRCEAIEIEYRLYLHCAVIHKWLIAVGCGCSLRERERERERESYARRGVRCPPV